jgi:hypothetical protein
MACRVISFVLIDLLVFDLFTKFGFPGAWIRRGKVSINDVLRSTLFDGYLCLQASIRCGVSVKEGMEFLRWILRSLSAMYLVL